MIENIKVTLPDGSVKDFEKGTTSYDVALSISEGLARNCIAVELNGKIKDLHSPIEGDSELKLLTLNNAESHEILLHSTAHIMAQAVKRLFPDGQRLVSFQS